MRFRMEESQAHRPSKLRSRLLYVSYLTFWLVAAIIAFMFLFPERWAQIRDSAEEVRAEFSQADESSTRIRPDSLKQLHNLMARSRWPLDVYRYHETIGYELTPGVSVKLLDRSYTSRTHELGFRIPLAQDQSPVEPGGLLSVGCSFTYGDHVEAEQAFTFVAGEILGIPSYNYGVNSYSYTGALLRLEELEQRGLFDQLQPSAIVLGAGDWLFGRSTSPFYPTNGLQYGYAYLAKENGSILIKQPPEQFSIKHQFEFSKRYFPRGRRESEFTPERQALLEEIAPTVFKAQSLKSRWEKTVTRQELYDFLAKRMHEVARSRNIPALILWIPANVENADPPQELLHAVKRYKNVHLLEGNRVVSDMNMKQKIRLGHPTKEAHRRYGEQIAKKLQEIAIEGAEVEVSR